MAEDRVVELRVHGVGGPTASDVLESVAPIPIDNAENEAAGFFTREEPGPVGQRVEAFVWGGLTSRTAIQAAWWLLLPFALVNVAGWMIRSGDAGRERPGRTVAWWIRFCMTLAGVFLTGLYLVWSAVALVDVTAYQCGAQPDCVSRSWLLPLRWLAGHPLWRISVGGFFVAVVLFGLLGAARVSHKRYEEYEPDQARRSMAADRPRALWTRNDNLKHPGFWYTWKEWRRLFYGHAYAGFAIVAALVGYGAAVADRATPFAQAQGWRPALVWSMILGAVCIAIAALLLRPPTYDDGGPLPDHAAKWAAAAALAAVTIVAAFAAGWGLYSWIGDDTPLEGGLGLPTAIAWLFAIQVVLLVPGLVLVAVNFSRHFRWRRFFGLTPPVNDGFRLWPPAVAVVAAMSIANAGFGAGIIRLADFLDRSGDTITFGSEEGGHLGSAGLAVDIFVIGLVVGLVLLLAPMARGLVTRRYAATVVDEYREVPSSSRKERFAKKVARARVVSQVGRNVDRLLTGMTVGVVAAASVVFVRLLLAHDFADIVQPFLGFGSDAERWTDGIRNTASVLFLLYVFPGAVIVRAGARNRGIRRQVGKVWDSVTFFPRRFHPLGPPCYAERAVPMLRERLRACAEAGERVVVRAHSQGTVLSFAALSQLVGEEQGPGAWVVGSPPAKEADDAYERFAAPGTVAGTEVCDHVALVTLGSPMGQLHGPFFPGYFSRDGYEEVREALGGRWDNFYRETDYIGKALFVDPEQELDVHGRFAGGGLVRPGDPDHSLADPSEAFAVMRRHSNYHKDAAVAGALDAAAVAFGATPEQGDLVIDLRQRLAEDPSFVEAVADRVARRGDP